VGHIWLLGLGLKVWRCAGSESWGPEEDAARTAVNNGLLPPDMEAHRGTSSQNGAF
jgi:hypothetical protein